MVKSCSAIFTVLILLAPSTLSAHAYLVKSVPAQRAVLYRAHRCRTSTLTGRGGAIHRALSSVKVNQLQSP
jgi:methionine-rich copper-binding protein CopC